MDFPPMYTRQPNEAAWLAQRQQWAQHILTVCQQLETRQWRLTDNTPLFTNTKINRKLDTATSREVINYMLDQKQLLKYAEREYFVLWNSLEQWASIILEFVERTAQTSSILTLFELKNTKGEKFEGMPEELMERIVDVLVKRGRGVVLKEGGKIVGVKIT